MPKVTLDWHEQKVASYVGAMRQDEALRLGLTRWPGGKPALQNNKDASGAEMAVGRYEGAYWYAGINTFDWPDVYPDIEVRQTDDPNGSLIIRPGSDRSRNYYLVRGTMPNYDIVGWINAAEGMNPKWLRDPGDHGPAYFVPASALREVAIGKTRR